MTRYDLALFFHLLGALLFVAGSVLAGVAFETARRQRRPGDIALLLGLARIGAIVVAVGSLLAGIFGLWLVHLGAFGYRTGWVDASIALYILALVLSALGGQRPKRARQLAARPHSDQDTVTPDVRKLLDDPLSRVANYASLLAILAVLVLMVFKP